MWAEPDGSFWKEEWLLLQELASQGFPMARRSADAPRTAAGQPPPERSQAGGLWEAQQCKELTQGGPWPLLPAQHVSAASELLGTKVKLCSAGGVGGTHRLGSGRQKGHLEDGI